MADNYKENMIVVQPHFKKYLAIINLQTSA